MKRFIDVDHQVMIVVLAVLMVWAAIASAQAQQPVPAQVDAATVEFWEAVKLLESGNPAYGVDDDWVSWLYTVTGHPVYFVIVHYTSDDPADETIDNLQIVFYRGNNFDVDWWSEQIGHQLQTE